ncbi:hypothetical protein Tco_0127565 [Tanacetum coccineum]
MVRWREATREGLSGLLEKNGDLYTKDIGEGFQKFQILPTNAKEEEESSSAEVQAAKEPIGRFPFVMLMMTRIYTIAITAKKLPPFYQPRARLPPDCEDSQFFVIHQEFHISASMGIRYP